MEALVSVFESVATNVPCKVTIGHSQHLLANFEPRDDSMNEDQLKIIADVVLVIPGRSRFYPVGSKLEFDVTEVMRVENYADGTLLFSSEPRNERGF